MRRGNEERKAFVDLDVDSMIQSIERSPHSQFSHL